MDDGITTNLQYGLDLRGGTWLQMRFQAEVVGFETDRPVSEFLTELQETLDAEIYLVGDNKIEIRKFYNESELKTAFTAAGGTLTSYEQGVSRETADQVKQILEQKLNALGTRDAKVNLLTGFSGVTQYVRVELAGVGKSQAEDIVGKQGKFEIRIHTAGNETEHVLYGDTISTVGIPSQEPGKNTWGVSFTLSEEGANQFREAAIRYGGTTNPDNHWLDMILDGETVYSAPLSPDLAANSSRPGRFSNSWHQQVQARKVYQRPRTLRSICGQGHFRLRFLLPVTGTIPAPLGEHFTRMCVYAFIAAALAVGVVIFYRYREPAIVLPMVGVNLSEIVILLGIAAVIQQQLDLAAIAGLIAVLGTGIDQLGNHH